MQSQRQSQSNEGPATGTTPAVAVNVRSPLAAYQGAAGVFDELLDANRAVRPVWRPFADSLAKIGAGELDRRWRQSQRLIEANGVAYSPHAGAGNRPWTLDPIPLLIPRQQWEVVSQGVAQRAKVLELLLADLYGPQQLVANGVLPADLLFAHPGYLLPLRRQQPSEQAARRMLHYYSADLARSPDGSWWVMADRTESPSGIGFALENRIVVSRMLPEPFRECNVLRLAGHFGELREALEQLSPDPNIKPRVAILSQGVGQPNYFEDAYLARYLGFLLVEGEDLTVRGRRLWLKTLEGLVPIEVLLRRPNTEQCDPLELGGAWPCGVAGLIQAARDGALAIANSLGSGLVESPVFMAFLPRLCQALLGEELKLPGVATWWCGEPESLKYVLANLDRFVLKHAYRQRGKETMLGPETLGMSPDDVAKAIQRNPRGYVAQERVERSSAPLWQDAQAQTCRVALRAYAIAQGEGYKVMEGALARTTPTADPLEISSLTGEGSKDVWIVSDDPVERVSLLTQEDEPIALVRQGAELPSRVADNSYWLGRHLERADAMAKLIRTVTIRLAGENDPTQLQELPPLLRALAEEGLIEPGYAVEELRELLPHVDRSLPSQVLNPQQTSSIASTVDRVFTSAAKVRDRLSRDTWRTLLRVRDVFESHAEVSFDLTDLLNALDDLAVYLAAIGGMVVESMTKTQFYRFLDIGRRLERAVQLADLLRVCLVEAGPAIGPLLEAVLESSDSLMTYRSRYRANMRFGAVLDLLVTDQSNPRSIAFQLNTLERHISKLPLNAQQPPGEPVEQRIISSLADTVRSADVEALAAAYDAGNAAPLAELLKQITAELPELSDAIALKYLVHAATPRQLSPM